RLEKWPAAAGFSGGAGGHGGEAADGVVMVAVGVRDGRQVAAAVGDGAAVWQRVCGGLVVFWWFGWWQQWGSILWC
nr:hypothetical protein [Tanacetum cinerariifolium]